MLIYNITNLDEKTGKERRAVVHGGQTLATRSQLSVSMYIGDDIIERRYMADKSQDYAIKMAENFVNNVIEF